MKLDTKVRYVLLSIYNLSFCLDVH